MPSVFDGSAVVFILGAFWPAVVSVFDVLTAGYAMSSVSDASPIVCCIYTMARQGDSAVLLAGWIYRRLDEYHVVVSK